MPFMVLLDCISSLKRKCAFRVGARSRFLASVLLMAKPFLALSALRIEGVQLITGISDRAT